MTIRQLEREELGEAFNGLKPTRTQIAVCNDSDSAAAVADLDEFDSRMLDRRIARLTHLRAASPAECTAVLEDLAARLTAAGYDQLIRRTATEDAPQIWGLTQAGFRIMDVGVTFARTFKDALEGPTYDDLVVRAASVEDVEAFAPSMVELPWGSRYESDPAYAESNIRRLREQWLKNSIEGRAQAFLVGVVDGAVAGYATGLLREDGGDIELVGTLPEFRRRRVSARIIDHLCAWFSSRARILRVRTQATNYAAAGLYEKAGFLLHQSDITFRLALTPAGGIE